MIALIISLIIIVLVVYTIYSRVRLVTKKNNIQQGERTIFEIDITDQGYTFYKNRIDKWLNDIGFSNSKAKSNDRFLTYYKNSEISTFGFNYYQKENKLIIEAWFPFLSKECPLKGSLYKQKEEDNSTEVKENVSVEELPIAIFKKYEYIELLKTLINLPEIIDDKNHVTLLENIDTSNINAKLKKQKSTTITFLVKLIMAIIIPSIIVGGLYAWAQYLNAPKLSKEEQEEALAIIQNTHTSFELTDSSYYGNADYTIYTYYGTMNTPENENDRVVIFMRKNSNGEWTGEIRQNEAYGEIWSFDLK